MLKQLDLVGFLPALRTLISSEPPEGIRILASREIELLIRTVIAQTTDWLNWITRAVAVTTFCG